MNIVQDRIQERPSFHVKDTYCPKDMEVMIKRVRKRFSEKHFLRALRDLDFAVCAIGM